MGMTSRTSDLKSADAAIRDRASILVGVEVITDRTNDVTLILYDNASAASGKVLAKIQVPGTEDHKYVEYPNVYAENGIYADVTGTGAEYIVHVR